MGREKYKNGLIETFYDKTWLAYLLGIKAGLISPSGDKSQNVASKLSVQLNCSKTLNKCVRLTSGRKIANLLISSRKDSFSN